MVGQRTASAEQELSEAQPWLERSADLVFELGISIDTIFVIGYATNSVSLFPGEIAEFGLSFLVPISIGLRYTRNMSATGREGGKRDSSSSLCRFWSQ